MSMRCQVWSRALALVLGLAAPAIGARAADAPDLWQRSIQPLFDVHCVKCHGPIEHKSGLTLDSPEGVFQGGDEGPVVVPGHPEQSRLLGYLEPGSDPHMPPKKQLTEAERARVRDWILALKRPSTAPTESSTPTPEFGSIREAIDAWIERGWDRFGVRPARPIDDRTWCRRVYLDLAGRIPDNAEVNDFLAQPAEGRRGWLVDRLLASADYPVRMRELWDVFLMGRPKRDAHEGRRRDNGWWSYLEDAFRANRGWDQIVRELLIARPTDASGRGASWFLYERRNDYQAIAEAVGPLVYGTRIDCAQCHDHPLAREVKQAHYWGLVSAFNRGKNVEGSTEIAESAIGGFVNFTNLKKESQPAVITLLGGATIDEPRPNPDTKEEDRDALYHDPKAKVRVPRFSRREAFATAATSQNPRLARAFVNRMWAVLLGRGLVHPVDEMTARNAPSHPELLEWLGADFAGHGYDIRRFLRGVVLSRAYALGPATGEPPAPESFAAALERPLTAEQIARSWRVALGLEPQDEPLRRALVTALPEVLPREPVTTFQQARFLTYSPELAALLRDLRPPTDRAKGSDAATDSGDETPRWFRAVFGREPDREESDRIAEFSREYADPGAARRDLLWALLTSAEFLTTP